MQGCARVARARHSRAIVRARRRLCPGGPNFAPQAKGCSEAEGPMLVALSQAGLCRREPHHSQALLPDSKCTLCLLAYFTPGQNVKQDGERRKLALALCLECTLPP